MGYLQELYYSLEKISSTKHQKTSFFLKFILCDFKLIMIH